MGILSKIFGDDQTPRPAGPGRHGSQSEDEQALERYRYMLKTAPPETIEQAHAEAFSRLTPQQRRLLLEQLSAEVPAAERAAVARMGDNPQALAQLATRAELRQPGTMERTFGGLGGRGLGGLMAGSFLSTMAGVVVGSMIAQQFFNHQDGASGGADDPVQQADAQDFQNPADDDFGSDMGDGGSFDV